MKLGYFWASILMIALFTLFISIPALLLLQSNQFNSVFDLFLFLVTALIIVGILLKIVSAITIDELMLIFMKIQSSYSRAAQKASLDPYFVKGIDNIYDLAVQINTKVRLSEEFRTKALSPLLFRDLNSVLSSFRRIEDSDSSAINKTKFFDAYIEFWVYLSIVEENKKLYHKQYQRNSKTKDIVSNYLISEKSFSNLRKTLYDGANIGTRYLDNSLNTHDANSYFVLSNLCAILWILEDNPQSLKYDLNSEIMGYVNALGKTLKYSNVEGIFENLMNLRGVINKLEKAPKPSICNLDELKFPDLQEKKYVKSELERDLYQQIQSIGLLDSPFDSFKLLLPENNALLTRFILDISYYIKDQNCTNIIGIERSGIPLASIVAYSLNIPLYILRTLPELKLLPNNLPGMIQDKNILLFDDITITGKNLTQATSYIQKLYKLNFNSIKKLTIISNEGLNTDSIISITYDQKSDRMLFKETRSKHFEKPPQLSFTDVNSNELKSSIRDKCVKDGYWYTEYCFCNTLFKLICDKLREMIIEKNLHTNSILISTSTFGLPFASVLSYTLKLPLYLFSRRGNLLLDFRDINKEDLTSAINSGKSIVFIDDIMWSGTTEDLAEQKLEILSEDCKHQFNINRFVVAYFGEKREDVNYIVEKKDLLENYSN